MMGQRPQCYITSFVEIGPPVQEVFLYLFTFLPYMGMAAILVMSLGLFIKTLFPPSHNALIGPAVSEKKIFENGGRRRTTDGRRTVAGSWPSYKLTL